MPTNATWIGSARRCRIWLARTIREVIGDDTVYAQCEPYMRQALAGDVAENEVEEPFPDGETRLLHIRYLPYREADGEVVVF